MHLLSKIRNFFSSILIGLALLGTVAACTPTVSTQYQTSQDGRFVQNGMYMTYQGSTRWVILVTDRAAGGAIVVNFGGETLTLGRQLVENMMNPGVLAALVSGAAGIQIAEKGSCGDGVCGTIIYNDGTAMAASQSGSVAEANANANSESGGGKGGGHVSSSGHDPALDLLSRKELKSYYYNHKLLIKALNS